MSREIKDLQKLIEERAAKKLKEDIKALGKAFNESGLAMRHNDSKEILKLHITVNAGSPSQRQDSITVEELFAISGYDGSITGPYLKALEKYWLPIYIERESIEFLKKVDQVEQDINYLLSNQPSQ